MPSSRHDWQVLTPSRCQNCTLPDLVCRQPDLFRDSKLSRSHTKGIRGSVTHQSKEHTESSQSSVDNNHGIIGSPPSSSNALFIDAVLGQLLLSSINKRNFHQICRVYVNEALCLVPYRIGCNELVELLPLQTLLSPNGTGTPCMDWWMDRYDRLDGF